MYSKLFGSIITSSIWSEDPNVCKIWITILALKDRKGFVFGSMGGLAHQCRLPVEAVRAAIVKFTSPDPDSSDMGRIPEQEGRRLEVIDGGWRVLNSEHYDSLKDADDRREQTREAVRRFRAKAKKNVIKSKHRKSTVTPGKPSEVEVEVESEENGKKTPLPGGPKDGPAWGLCRYFKNCKMPSGPSKKAAFEDLIRQGVTYEAIKASGENPDRKDWDFFDHIKVLRPPSKVANHSSKPILKTPF